MADWEVDDDDVEGLEEFDDLYKEDDAEEAVEVAEEAEDSGPKVDISKITSSAERNILSKRNRIWSVHAVLRPRRALPHDATDDWVERYFPEHLADFANPKLNREALGALQSCAQKKELQNFVVHGPRGAGKTAACLAFLRGFAADDGSAKSKRSRGKKAKQQRASGGAYPTLRLSSADAKTAGDLEKKLKAFVREAERVNGEGSTKFVVLDGIDSLTPHAQQGVYHNMISYDKTVGFLFTALNAAVDDLVARVAAAEAFIAGTMCIDEAVYRKRRKEVHDDHDAITSKIGKFLPEQPPLNDDGKFAFPPDPLRLALEYLLKLGESPPAKDDGPKKKAGIPKQRRR